MMLTQQPDRIDWQLGRLTLHAFDIPTTDGTYLRIGDIVPIDNNRNHIVFDIASQDNLDLIPAGVKVYGNQRCGSDIDAIEQAVNQTTKTPFIKHQTFTSKQSNQHSTAKVKPANQHDATFYILLNHKSYLSRSGKIEYSALLTNPRQNHQTFWAVKYFDADQQRARLRLEKLPNKARVMAKVHDYHGQKVLNYLYEI